MMEAMTRGNRSLDKVMTITYHRGSVNQMIKSTFQILIRYFVTPWKMSYLLGTKDSNSTPYISSGSEHSTSHSGPNDPHYSGDAIDISGREYPGGPEMSVPTLENIAKDLTGQAGHHPNNNNEDPTDMIYPWPIPGVGPNGTTVNATVIVEHPGTENQHIHIQLPPNVRQPLPQGFHPYGMNSLLGNQHIFVSNGPYFAQLS